MFDCPYKGCGKIYSTKYNLQRHCLISHRKSKRFSCKICKKILSSNQNLKEHIYTHSQEKPLQCTFPGCRKVFRQSSQLSSHKKIHKSEMLNEFKKSPEIDWTQNNRELEKAFLWDGVNTCDGEVLSAGENNRWQWTGERNKYFLSARNFSWSWWA